MKRSVVLGIVGVLLLTATGCGGPDALMKEFIANLTALAETIEKKESKEKQQAAIDRVKTTQDKIDKLKLSDGEKENLKKKYEKDIEAALKRIGAAALKAAQDGGDVLPNLGDIKIK